MCSTGDIMTGIGIIAAPFTGGASLGLTALGQASNAKESAKQQANRQADAQMRAQVQAKKRADDLLKKQEQDRLRTEQRGQEQQATAIQAGRSAARAATRPAPPLSASPLIQNTFMRLGKPKLGGG